LTAIDGVITNSSILVLPSSVTTVTVTNGIDNSSLYLALFGSQVTVTAMISGITNNGNVYLTLLFVGKPRKEFSGKLWGSKRI